MSLVLTFACCKHAIESLGVAKNFRECANRNNLRAEQSEHHTENHGVHIEGDARG